MIKLSSIKANPNNPRVINDAKFKKLVQSIKDFPELTEKDIVVVSDTMVVLGKSKNGKIKLRLCECRKCGEWFNDKSYSKGKQRKYCSRNCYYGKIEKIAESDIVLQNKKKIKKGQKYHTRYYPLNGKL